jgi:6-phosphogluconolactonase/glucosamine-6-phosphate isomerase/deaminase
MLAKQLCEAVVKQSQSAVADHGSFSIALSGEY